MLTDGSPQTLILIMRIFRSSYPPQTCTRSLAPLLLFMLWENLLKILTANFTISTTEDATLGLQKWSALSSIHNEVQLVFVITYLSQISIEHLVPGASSLTQSQSGLLLTPWNRLLIEPHCVPVIVRDLIICIMCLHRRLANQPKLSTCIGLVPVPCG